MITAQDIREKTFNKARLSGYDMSEVDDFLEELAEDITAGDIRITRNSFEYLHVFPEIIIRGDIITNDCERDSADSGKKANQHTGFADNLRHYLMDLFEHLRCLFLDQSRIGNLHIINAPALICASNPEQLILE